MQKENFLCCSVWDPLLPLRVSACILMSSDRSLVPSQASSTATSPATEVACWFGFNFYSTVCPEKTHPLPHPWVSSCNPTFGRQYLFGEYSLSELINSMHSTTYIVIYKWTDVCVHFRKPFPGMAVPKLNSFTFKVSASISFRVWFHESQNQCQFSKQTVLTRLHEPEWREKHFKNSWPDIPLGGLGYVKAFCVKLMPHMDCWPLSELFEASSVLNSACKWDQTKHTIPRKW